MKGKKVFVVLKQKQVEISLQVHMAGIQLDCNFTTYK